MDIGYHCQTKEVRRVRSGSSFVMWQNSGRHETQAKILNGHKHGSVMASFKTHLPLYTTLILFMPVKFWLMNSHLAKENLPSNSISQKAVDKVVS